MLVDFEVQRSTRRCASTDRPLEPGEECFAALAVSGAHVIRADYCREAWSGPPDGSLGWWRWRVPEASTKRIKLAPNDVLLNLFDQFGEQPDHEDYRYVLALLLIRRRVFRLELPPSASDEPDSAEGESRDKLHVFCPKRNAYYMIAAVMPNDARTDEIQRQLSDLLVSGAD